MLWFRLFRHLRRDRQHAEETSGGGGNGRRRQEGVRRHDDGDSEDVRKEKVDVLTRATGGGIPSETVT